MLLDNAMYEHHSDEKCQVNPYLFPTLMVAQSFASNPSCAGL